MFWKKSEESTSLKKENYPHQYRFCDLYISDKHKQIIFVTFEKLKEGIYGESYNLISDSWPCKFENLQTNIETILKRFLSSDTHVDGK